MRTCLKIFNCTFTTLSPYLVTSILIDDFTYQQKHISPLSTGTELSLGTKREILVIPSGKQWSFPSESCIAMEQNDEFESLFYALPQHTPLKFSDIQTLVFYFHSIDNDENISDKINFITIGNDLFGYRTTTFSFVPGQLVQSVDLNQYQEYLIEPTDVFNPDAITYLNLCFNVDICLPDQEPIKISYAIDKIEMVPEPSSMLILGGSFLRFIQKRSHKNRSHNSDFS